MIWLKRGCRWSYNARALRLSLCRHDRVPKLWLPGFRALVAVAQAALAFSRGVFAETKVYSDAKPIWGTSSSGEAEVLSSVPQLRSLYTEAERRFTALDAFVAACEDELAEVLLANDTPDAALVEARTQAQTLRACCPRSSARTEVHGSEQVAGWRV